MKRQKIKYGLYFLITVLSYTGCTQNAIDAFNDGNSLFFFRGEANSKGHTQMDSMSYSFFLSKSLQIDTLWVDVQLTGIPSGMNRPIPIGQANAGQAGAAVAGTHYVAFNDPGISDRIVMPANQVKASIPIILKRTADMDAAEFRLDLTLTANEYFITGIKNRTSYTVKITAQAIKPALWDNANSFKSVFGDWGQEKMRFIIDYVEYSDFDEIPNNDYRTYLRIKARAKLAEYEAEHGPLYEADNVTRVIFP